MDNSHRTSQSTHNNVLLVDDDPAILRLLAAWLEMGGYAVHQASDGLQALECIEEACPDFLITDWEMPHMDGPTLCRRVRDMRLPHYTYIVFLTSRKDRDDIIGGLNSGADDFLSKPVQKSELLARMLAGGRVLELERQLSHMAKSDMLTGLNTRRTFFDFLEKEWSRAARRQLPMSCVMFDIDFFKRINDQHGHPVGDLCLQTVARLFTENCRSSDVICRFAGDEFLALLPETEQAQAAAWAERLRVRIGEERLCIDGAEIRLAATFGVAERLDCMVAPQELVAMADQTLLLAKQAGRDCVFCCEGLYSGTAASQQLPVATPEMFGTTTVRDIMTPYVARLRNDQPIERAVGLFARLRCPYAAVVDRVGKLCGLLAPKDLTEVIVFPQAWSRPVREFMSANVVSFEVSEPAANVYEFLCRAGLSSAMVVDEKRPVGVVQLASILGWVEGSEPQGATAGVTELDELLHLANSLQDAVQELFDQADVNMPGLSSHIRPAAQRIGDFADRLVARDPTSESGGF